ncbi:MAG: hypothetical protein E6J91_10155 [Deltaproteobacteria bacterium]|nr:MAG: hypothetical protein E6J91_10155 [Deltaproteobacteria bacterium]
MAVSRTPIPTFLQRVRVLVYQHEVRRAVLYSFAAVAGIALVLPLVGAVVGASRATALAVLGLGGLVAVLLVISAVVLGVVAPRRRWGGDSELARWVGGRRREIASDLLSAVELARAPARPGAPSRDLVNALVEVTSARLDDIDPHSLVEPSELKRARRWAVVAVALNLAILVIAPHVVADGWRSLVSARPAPFDGARLSAAAVVVGRRPRAARHHRGAQGPRAGPRGHRRADRRADGSRRARVDHRQARRRSADRRAHDRSLGALPLRDHLAVGRALDRDRDARDRGRAGPGAGGAADGAGRSARCHHAAAGRARLRDRG